MLAASPVDGTPKITKRPALVRDACFAASVPNYRTGPAAPLEAIPHLYFMDPIGGRSRDGARVAADFGVDVEAAFEIKRAMLAAHASQMSWVSRQHGLADHLATMERWTRDRARPCRRSLRGGFPSWARGT